MLWSNLSLPDRRLKMLCVADCGLSLEGARAIISNVKPDHHHLTYLDLHGNYLGNDILQPVITMLQGYDLLEFIGLGKNNIDSVSKVAELLSLIGKTELTPEQLAKIQERTRERNMIIEKNKKLRTLKKPEEYVFYVETPAFSEETKTYYINSKENMRFINLMENRFVGNGVLDAIKDCYMRAPQMNFSLEGNKPTFPNMSSVKNLFGHKVIL